MSKHLITIILLFSTLPTLAQDKTIVLQIDTLELHGHNNFSISIIGQGFANIIDEIDDSVYIRNDFAYPNFICPLTFQTDTSSLQISIDNQGGYLLITDIYQSQCDTLRINKLTVFDNCYRDTIYTRISYYYREKDVILENSFKTKYLKTIEKEKCKNKTPQKVHYIINHQHYFVSLQKQKDIGVQMKVFQGNKPRSYSKKRDNYKGRSIRFNGISTNTHYINIGVLKIKNDC